MKTCYLALFLLGSFSGLIAQNVFFSEEFNNTLPTTWRSIEVQGNRTASAKWVWTRTGPEGSFATAAIASTTAANGWMIFNSDLNCRNNTQDAWLLAPRQSGTGKSAIFLTFQSFYRTYNDVALIQVSSDSINWTSIPVFPNLRANDFGGDTNPETVTVDLTTVAAGKARFWFAFRFFSSEETKNGGDVIGCGYNWQIDDVKLLDADPRSRNNLSISETAFAVAPNLITPASQVEPFGFFAEISNLGAIDQTKANFNIRVVDAGRRVVAFTDNITIDTLERDSTGDAIFTRTFTPEAKSAVYQGVYRLTLSEPDADTLDNVRLFAFAVSDSIFSKFLNVTGGIRPSGNQLSYSFGNCFYFPKGEGMYGRYVIFAVDNPEDLAGRSVNILTYKWNGDANFDLMATPNEYDNAPVAFNTYTFSGDEMDFITVPMSIDEVGVPLENDSYYFTVIQYETDDQQPLFMSVSEEVDYSATFAWSAFVNQRPRYMSMLDVGNTGNYNAVGFGFDVIAAVDISIGKSPNLTTNTVTILSEENNITISPNPATDHFLINLDLLHYQEVGVKIMNIEGKVIAQLSPRKLQKDSLRFDSRAFESGVYFAYIEAEEGVRTIKLVVSKQ